MRVRARVDGDVAQMVSALAQYAKSRGPEFESRHLQNTFSGLDSIGSNVFLSHIKSYANCLAGGVRYCKGWLVVSVRTILFQ